MAKITEKELSALGDLLSFEQTCIAKCQAAANATTDKALADTYNTMATRHQRHFDELYANLK